MQVACPREFIPATSLLQPVYSFYSKATSPLHVHVAHTIAYIRIRHFYHRSLSLQGSEVPDGGAILVFVLLADMLHTIISEIISLSTDGRQAAIATISTFVLIVILVFGTLVFFNLVYIYCCDEDIEIKIILLVAQTIGALFYFYGDNITKIINQYGEELGCGSRCRENNRIAATICLGIALLFYQLVPPCLHKLQVIEGSDSSSEKWYSASDMMVTIVKIDALYTVVAVMAQTEDFCSLSDLSISVSFLLISFIAGIILLVVYCIIYSITLSDDKNAEDYFWVPWVAFILLAICFPMYVLADNAQPLDCAFGCDTFASNQTINDIGCNQVGNSELRLGFTLVSFIIVSSLSIVLSCCQACETKVTKIAKII